MASDTIKVEWLDQYNSWQAHGGGRGSTNKDTKREAVKAAKALGKRYGKRVKVYKKSGGLQNTFDYRDDTSSGGGGGGGLGSMLGF